MHALPVPIAYIIHSMGIFLLLLPILQWPSAALKQMNQTILSNPILRSSGKEMGFLMASLKCCI